MNVGDFVYNTITGKHAKVVGKVGSFAADLENTDGTQDLNQDVANLSGVSSKVYKAALPPKPKKISGEWSALHLQLAETSVKELVAEFAATGQPVQIGAMRWARRVYNALNIPLEMQTVTPTTLPQFLVKDGYAVKVEGGYVPTGKAFAGMSNKLTGV